MNQDQNINRPISFSSFIKFEQAKKQTEQWIEDIVKTQPISKEVMEPFLFLTKIK